jgi:hypothetical protein
MKYFSRRQFQRIYGVWISLILLSTAVAKADQSGYFYYVPAGSSAVITNYSGPGGDVAIPSTLNNLPVSGIGADAFFACNTVTNVIIPPTVTSIGDYAFYDCTGLRSMIIPTNVMSLGSWVFAYCSKLASVSIGPGTTNVGDYDFQYCTSLTNLSLGAGLITIGANAFDSCTSLTTVSIPNSVTNLEGSAFADCVALTRITIPDGISSIASSTFYGCSNLATVIVGKNVTSVGADAFSGCSSLASIFFTGNAPASFPASAISGSSPAIYYLSGASNWNRTLGGQPTILWNPTLQAGAAGFRLPPNTFSVAITGTTNIPIVLEACTNLSPSIWVPVLNCTLTNGLLVFTDPNSANYSACYYRICLP